jgi:hypothetical protein
MNGLTPKQEAFCLAYVEIGNASEAYRRAYDAGQMKPAVVNVKACELLARGKIAVRVEELKTDAVERHRVTVDDIARMLQEDREFARQCRTPAAAVSATMGLAKLYGFLTDKVEHAGSIDRPPEMTAEEARNIIMDRLTEGLQLRGVKLRPPDTSH